MYKLVLLSVIASIFAAPQDQALTNGKTSIDSRHPIKQVPDLALIFEMLLEYTSKMELSKVTTDIQNNQYFMTMIIKEEGFDDKEITVNAKKGLVWIEANSTDTGKYYIDAKKLSECVNPAGSWTYEQNNLKMVFPMIAGCLIVTTTTETPNVKETDSSANHSA